jgi:hypothetical protein
MIKFLVVGRTPFVVTPVPVPNTEPREPYVAYAPDAVDRACRYAAEQGWARLGAMRFATPQKDDIRVVERLSELFPGGGVMTLIRGPGFNENHHAEDFESLVEQGAARWDE